MKFIVIAVLCFLSALIIPVAKAADSPEIQTVQGLVCDTQEQLESLVKHLHNRGEFQEAVNRLNQKRDPTLRPPCASGTIFFTQENGTDATIEAKDDEGRTVKIWRVVIHGYRDPDGKIASTPPLFEYVMPDVLTLSTFSAGQ